MAKRKPKKRKPGEHSPVGASSRYRYSKCPGSVRECAKVPHKTSSYAEEGTEAHEYLANFVEQLKRGQTPDFSIVPTANGMRDAIEQAVEWIDSQMGNKPQVWVELPMSAEDIDEDAWGTGDVVIYHSEIKLLQTIDYKHGAGVFVEAEKNLQNASYIIYAIKTLGLDVEQIEGVILQPRYPDEHGEIARVWKIDASELPAMEFDLYNDIQATKMPNAPLVAGKHCQFCDASAVCPQLKNERNRAAVEIFSDGQIKEVQYDGKPIAQLTPDEMGDLQRVRIPALRAWLKGAEEYIYDQAVNHGNLPTGMKLVGKKANRSWIDEEGATETLQLLGHTTEDVTVKPKLKSPAQIEKLFKNKKEAQDTVAPLVKKKSSGSVLVSESDKRPAIAHTSAEDFFGKEA